MIVDLTLDLAVDPRVELAAELRRRREALACNVSEAARRVGVTQPTLRDWESGSRAPSLTNLARLAHAYGVPISELSPLHASAQRAHHRAWVTAVREATAARVHGHRRRPHRSFRRLGRRIRRARLDAGLDLGDAAVATWISPRLLWLIERGYVPPTGDQLARLAARTGVAVAELVRKLHAGQRLRVGPVLADEESYERQCRARKGRHR